MKKLAIMVVLSLGSGMALADCPALDYQEMKEMKVGDLSKEYCKVKAKTLGYISDSRAESKYSNDLRGINAISGSRQREDDASEALGKAVKLQESADQCRSQEARIERVLALNGVSESEVKGMCKK